MTRRHHPRLRPAPLAAGLLLVLATTACSGGAAPTQASPSSAPPVSAPGASSGAEPSQEATPMDPTSPPGWPIPGAIVAQAVDDAASRAGVDPSAVTVVTADAVTWPNGAAGCPKPGFMYTEVITPGYRVVVEAGGATHDYRGTVQGGSVSLCENPTGPGAEPVGDTAS